MELLELAHLLGNHPSRLALWTEGSVAEKTGPNTFITSSRKVSLARLKEDQLVELDLQKTNELLALEDATAEDLLALRTDPEGPVPSLDSLAHGYLLGLEGIKFCTHTQPIEVNQITASPRARQFADRRTVPTEILSAGSASVLVPYTNPGLQLAKEIKRKIHLWRDRYKVVPKLILVQNHGMFVLGESADEVLGITEMTVKSAQIFIGAGMMGGPVFLTPNNVLHIEATGEV